MQLPIWATIVIVIVGMLLSIILAILIAKIVAPLFIQRIEREKEIQEQLRKLDEIKKYISQIKYKEVMEEVQKRYD